MLLETRLDPKRTGEKVCVDTSQTLCGHMWPLSKFNKATVENTRAPRRYGLLRRRCPSAAGHCCQEGLRCAPGLREPGWVQVWRCLSGVWRHNSRKCLIRTKPRPLTCKTTATSKTVKLWFIADWENTQMKMTNRLLHTTKRNMGVVHSRDRK